MALDIHTSNHEWNTTPPLTPTQLCFTCVQTLSSLPAALLRILPPTLLTFCLRNLLYLLLDTGSRGKRQAMPVAYTGWLKTQKFFKYFVLLQYCIN